VEQKPKRLFEYETLYSPFNVSPITFKNQNQISMVVSGDYTFPNSFYIHTEILYNNLGATEYTSLFDKEAGEIGLLSASRFSVYQEFSYNISPLTRSSIFTILNPDDKSYVVVPSLTHSIITNLDLYLIALLFVGNDYSQYGKNGHSFYARLKYSF
jgi:hypothetical protein